MDEASTLLADQVAYYRGRAGDYLEQARQVTGFDELEQALATFGPSGAVLELACGPGTWTPTLLATAATVTAVDAAAEMLEQARRRVPSERVEFVHADVFTWRPERQYDTVFFGFWLSHVPADRFDAFWRLVQDALTPTGRVIFMDDAQRTTAELVEGPSSSTIVRRTADGSAHRLVKVPYVADQLQQRLAELGWSIGVQALAGGLFWGSGARAR